MKLSGLAALQPLFPRQSRGIDCVVSPPAGKTGLFSVYKVVFYAAL